MPRYRDRHQARDASRALTRGRKNFEMKPFACQSCKGFHLEKVLHRPPIVVASEKEPSAIFLNTINTRKRRHFLVDIENFTGGAGLSPLEARQLWNIVKHEAPGVAPRDHVVIGAGRYVHRKYRAAFQESNIEWVVGEHAKDGADRALLNSIDLRWTVKNFDELVIVSGDYAFADLARRARELGLTVHVITAESQGPRPTLSRALREEAHIRTLVRRSTRAGLIPGLEPSDRQFELCGRSNKAA